MPMLGSTPVPGGCTWLAIILVNMMIVVAPAAWARTRTRPRARRWSGTRLTPSSRQIAGAWQRWLVIIHGFVTLFSWCDFTCNHPSCHRTCCSSHSCRCIEGNCGANCLNDYSWIVDCCGCIGCFDDSCDVYNCNVDGSSMHGYVQLEVEPFSFPLAACPWQSSQECQLPCWLLDTAQRRRSSWVGQQVPSCLDWQTCSGAP